MDDTHVSDDALTAADSSLRIDARSESVVRVARSAERRDVFCKKWNSRQSIPPSKDLYDYHSYNEYARLPQL